MKPLWTLPGTVEDKAPIAGADVNRELISAADAAEIGGSEFPRDLSNDDLHGEPMLVCHATLAEGGSPVQIGLGWGP